ncbi:MAG: tetratricopeptide repeat protein [Candidatus Obscuribacterales bacterium]|nr:MAG: tetratricopeptide repeat protein [Candidatus Melainabacteria bacterium]
MDPLYIAFFVVLLLISAVIIPKVLKAPASEADSLLTTALLKKQSGSFSEAAYYLERALAEFESEAVPDFGKMCTCIVQLAECQTRSSNYAEARKLYERLIELWMTAISKDNPEAYLDIDYLASTASFGAGTSDVVDAYEKVIEAKRKVFGQNHPDVANSLRIRALLLRTLGREDDAKQSEAAAESIGAAREKPGSSSD